MEEKRLTPIKAIRAKCLDCCCGNSNEVKLCTCTGCALYPYREGHNPFIQKQEWTEERKLPLGYLYQVRGFVRGFYESEEMKA